MKHPKKYAKHMQNRKYPKKNEKKTKQGQGPHLPAPRPASEEPATTTEGQGQEHDNTKGGEAQEHGNRTLEINMEQVFEAEDEDPRSSPGNNTVHISQPPPKHMDVDVGAHEESATR
jgi:hypothetical protein